MRVRFSVDEAFRDATGRTIELSTPDQTTTCGYRFEAGQAYLVFAHRTARGLFTSICSRTAPLSAGRDNLDILREASRGAVRSRLHGNAMLLMSRMNGTLLPAIVGGIPDIKIVARTGSAVHETTTDPNYDPCRIMRTDSVGSHIPSRKDRLAAAYLIQAVYP